MFQIFLLFALLFSVTNHFLILNEEIIVAICFISFILFSFQFLTIENSLDERNTAIKNEFHQALILEEKYSDQIKHIHSIKSIGFYSSFIQNILTTKCLWYEHFCQQYFTTNFKQTLGVLIQKQLVKKEDEEEKWFNFMAHQFMYSVAYQKKQKNKKFQENLWINTIQILKL